MKLKESFITHEIDGTQFLVPVGADDFSGMVRSNETAAFIVNCLKEDISEDGIVNAMCAEYNAPREVIAADVKVILDKLRSVNALDE